MRYEHVRLEQGAGLALLTLDRPPLNVLDLPALRELRAALDEAASADGWKVLLITGAGRAFCAGVDVADHTADRIGETLPLFHEVVRRIWGLEMPVIAAVNGAALGGGCELALACDLVLAREDARIGQPEIRLGVFPPVAAALLPGRIGPQRAAELVLTGRTLSATEAREWGLVTEVLPADGFAHEVERAVSGLTALSRPALRLAKRALRAGLELPFDAALERAEALYLGELMRCEDPHEGLAAFLEKRRPVWKDA